MTQEEIIKLVRELFKLAGADYSEYDAMANNPTPEEEAIKLLSKAINQTREEVVGEIEEFIAKQYPWVKPIPNQVVNYYKLVKFLKSLKEKE